MDNLFGRRQIFTNYKEDEIDDSNIVEIINTANTTHQTNVNEIEYLYNYYKGDQPILDRTKEVRDDILNKIVENRANEIVNFKVAYLCGEPITYVARNSDSNVVDNVAKLNGMMLSESKASKDRELFEWQFICGTSYRMILPDSNFDDSNDELEEAPFELFTLDPRQAFVIYKNDYSKKPLLCVYTVTNSENETVYNVYSKDKYWEIINDEITNTDSYSLGRLPIIEYPCNNSRLGAFEVVLPLLDALNVCSSNRLDGVEQFIQSLLVLYNCQLDDDVTANRIREQGMILLKSIGENKADIKEISSELNQTQTQTLVDYLYNTVLTIVGMPSQSNASQSDSSNNGAVILKNGWQSAEARAKDSELMFKQSEQETIKLVLTICQNLEPLNLKISDIDYRFTRRCYEDVYTKSQVLNLLLSNDKVNPKLAFNVSGLFSDPETAYKESMDWFNSLQSNITNDETLNDSELMNNE